MSRQRGERLVVMLEHVRRIRRKDYGQRPLADVTNPHPRALYVEETIARCTGTAASVYPPGHGRIETTGEAVHDSTAPVAGATSAASPYPTVMGQGRADRPLDSSECSCMLSGRPDGGPP